MAPKPSPAADSSALVREYLAQSKRGRRLAGRVAIVTGAGSLQGIGRSAVIALAEAGCRAVFAVDIRSEDDFASLKAECAPFDARLICVVADASEESDVRGLCERAVTEFGRLDIFYANAGISSSECGNWRHACLLQALNVPLALRPHRSSNSGKFHAYFEGQLAVCCPGGEACKQSDARHFGRETGTPRQLDPHRKRCEPGRIGDGFGTRLWVCFCLS